MATDEEKARNQRLRDQAMAAKVARKTRSETRAETLATYQPKAEDVAKTFGGLSGNAAQVLMGRSKKIEDAIKE